MTAHGFGLMSNDAHVRARFAGAQQHVAGFAVGRKVRIGIGLVHLARPVETSGAGEAASLVTDGRELDARFGGRVPDVLVFTHPERELAFGCDQDDAVELRAVGHRMIVIAELLNYGFAELEIKKPNCRLNSAIRQFSNEF